MFGLGCRREEQRSVGAMGTDPAGIRGTKQLVKGDCNEARNDAAGALGDAGARRGRAAQSAGITVIGPGETDVVTASVYGGHWTEVGVVGDGDTDLDLYVYDPAGRLVGYDEDPTDDCLVRFYAWMTGTYTIKVVNRSNSRSNAYLIGIR